MFIKCAVPEIERAGIMEAPRVADTVAELVLLALGVASVGIRVQLQDLPHGDCIDTIACYRGAEEGVVVEEPELT
jgi:hypothetical protein